jgi:hypothetical protein
MHAMVLLGDEAHVEARFGPFGVMPILMQDRCTVCAERSKGAEIFLDAPDGARFGPFGDSVIIDAGWVHVLCQTYHRLRNHFGRT